MTLAGCAQLLQEQFTKIVEQKGVNDSKVLTCLEDVRSSDSPDGLVNVIDGVNQHFLVDRLHVILVVKNYLTDNSQSILDARDMVN